MVAIESLRSHWRSALLTADAALKASDAFLSPDARHELRKHLSEEYPPTTALLRVYARDEGISPELAEPFLPRARARHALRLPVEAATCVLELDGVLVAGDGLHMAAWQHAFDEQLEERVEATFQRVVAPFDPTTDYPKYLRGRQRLDGVRAFLQSRGIRLPEEDIHALATRKSEVYRQLLDEHGIRAYDGVRHCLELTRDAGARCVVLSASEHAEVVLERAGLAQLVDEVTVRASADPAKAALFVASEQELDPGYLLVVLVSREAARKPEGVDILIPSLGSLLLR